MLTESSTDPAPVAWQTELRQSVRDGRELLRMLQLPESVMGTGPEAASFPIFAPQPYVRRIQIGNPHDPLLLQILPQPNEDAPQTGTADPLNENNFQLAPGLLKKYRGRALLVVNGRCAIHCRYCFRRHFPYDTSPQATGAWEEIVAAIQDDPDIHEVILSGGDPLTMTDSSFDRLLNKLESIDRITRVRIHTRLPIVIPSRITPALVDRLLRARPVVVMVVHCNHPNEIDVQVEHTLEQLRSAGITVLNQSVLLAGINDDANCLVQLSERLFQCGVLPYYLHQLDPVRGAMHFQVPVERGIQLIDSLRERLPGYLVPRYVQEIPGRPSKTPLA